LEERNKQLPKLRIEQIEAIIEALIGMPCFVILPKDKAAVPAIEDYILRSNAVGGRNIVRSTARMTEFADWQKANPGQLKIPD
jgi:hypothetical protein